MRRIFWLNLEIEIEEIYYYSAGLASKSGRKDEVDFCR